MTATTRSPARSGVARASIADAYNRTGTAWHAGPGPVYERLAEVVIARLPAAVAGPGATLLDVGAGTGAVSAVAARRGADVVAIDVSAGMLAHRSSERPPAVVGDACALPFDREVFDAAVAAFSVNHLTRPAVAVAEMARVVRPGGAVVVTAYAHDDNHPAKAAVESAVTARGWRPAAWCEEVRRHAMPLLASVGGALAVAADAGLAADAEHLSVPVPDLTPIEMVRWRLGMAQTAPFVSSLPESAQQEIEADALAALGPSPEPLVRRIILLVATRPGCARHADRPRSA